MLPGTALPQSTQHTAVATGPPFGPEPRCLRQQQSFPFVLQHGISAEDWPKDCAAKGARGENEKNKARQAASKPRRQRRLFFGPSILCGAV
jgi:hypothetical protein